MTRILVTGAGGQVGSELVAIRDSPALEVVACTRHQLDITDEEAVTRTVAEAAPDVVVNAAAYTGVDRAEDEPELAMAVNADGVGHLAAAAEAAGAALIQISTDYVFDGTKQGWYPESDPISPLGAYGRSKAAGEEAARDVERHTILRTAWVYSATPPNFVATMLRLAAERDELGVVDDQVGCPTSAGDLAAAIVQIARRVGSAEELRGTYHVASPQDASWFEFACAILEPQISAGEVTVRPITTDEFPTPAARPANSRLDSNRIFDEAGIRLPDWSDSLPGVVAQLLQQRP